MTLGSTFANTIGGSFSRPWISGGEVIPTVAGRSIIVFGDSRTANATENSTTAAAQRVTARSYIAWALAASGYSFKLTGNYGINTDTIDGCVTRLTGAGISGGTAPGDPRRGWVNVYDPGNSANVAVVLVGVNNTNESMVTAAQKYDALFMGLIDDGKVVVICNELPNSDQFGQGPFNIARRDYLAGWPATSSGMTAQQKATYAAAVVKVDTYTAAALTPNSYFPKAGYYPAGDLLHPGTVGNRAIGEAIAEALKKLAAKAGFGVRNALPANAADCLLTGGMLTGSTAITAANGETAGAGGANMNGVGGVGVTGAVPTGGWSVVRGGSLQTLLNGAQNSRHQLTCTVSKTTDSDGFDAVRLRVTGRVGTTADRYSISFRQEQYKSAASLANLNGLGGGVTDGDELFSIARVQFAANPRGLLGTNVEVLASSATYPSTAFASMSGSISGSGLQYDGMPAFDAPVMSQGRVLPSGFASTVETKTFNQQFSLWILGGVAVDVDVTISRFGVVKNR